MANGFERREFLKVLGASGAGAALAGCSTGTTAEKLIPYVVPDENIVPGISTWYRTTCMECPAGCGMNVRTREGRAIKAEGNPLSAISHGKLCARGQASLHGLYNPDRVPQALARNGNDLEAIGWDDAEQRLADALAQNRGRAAFLTEGLTGSMDALVDEFCQAFGIDRVRWEPFALEPIRAAYRTIFGVDALPVHDFGNADYVLTFGADFMETWLSPIDYAHGYVQGHSYDRGRRGHLVSVTPHQSLTDMNSDEWLAVRPGTEHLVALAIARAIVDGGAQAGGAAGMLGTVNVDANATAAGVSADRLREIATAFANGGRSVAVGPGIATMHGSATAVAAAVAVLNSVAGNIGSTVRIGESERGGASAGSYADMKNLVTRMSNNEIGALLVYGPNPLYAMAGDENIGQAIGNVGFVASFATYQDETAERAHLMLPDHHFLEAWGDAVPRTGTHALVQPVMTPVFDTKQTGDVLLSVARRANAALSSSATTYYGYLRDRWAREVYPATAGGQPFETWWVGTLKTGFVAGDVAAASSPALSAEGLGQIGFGEATFEGNAEDPVLIVYPSYKYYDGRMANRPWLQELPDPVNKFAWSSCVEIHPDRAEAMGLDTGHIVDITVGDRTVRASVWRNPAMRSDVIALQIGQGHESFGTYAVGRGANAMHLLSGTVEAASGALVWQQTRASIKPTGRWERPIKVGLTDTQHGRGVAKAQTLGEAVAADRGRGLTVIAGAGVVAAPPQQAGGEHEEEVHPLDARVTELQGAGGFTPEEFDASPAGYPPPGTWYGEYSNAPPRWGMVIDLEKCIGCSACTTACYAENNIGIVGPKLVAQGRILQWIRIERYFEQEEGSDELHTRFLPMLCQQCGNAPCEPVCPVFASYHTPDGLNAQVYNRCVGTRYCANNCPYKVRNFNYFSYEWPSPLNWQLNPDVTVREKGVMEKCSFCVQRIRETENHARLEDRGVHDGEIVPACAQTCPGDAIVFGNMRDPESRVVQAASSGRGYRVFEELNTQSAITYLRKIVAEA
jgi:anaerobic selenocysteine-containing dehydrogenase/Fe-S-cluster-containing dehydrogenase component